MMTPKIFTVKVIEVQHVSKEYQIQANTAGEAQMLASVGQTVDESPGRIEGIVHREVLGTPSPLN